MRACWVVQVIEWTVEMPYPATLANDTERAALAAEVSGKLFTLAPPPGATDASAAQAGATEVLTGGVTVVAGTDASSAYLNNTMELPDAVRALQAVSGVRGISVERSGNVNTGYAYAVTFTPEDYATGAVPRLRVLSNDLIGAGMPASRVRVVCKLCLIRDSASGRTKVDPVCKKYSAEERKCDNRLTQAQPKLTFAGTNVKVEQAVIQQARPERELKPIPADFLRAPVTTPHTVIATVNGIVSACRGPPAACSFENGEAAAAIPRVTGMAPASGKTVEAGAVLTFSGEGLAKRGGMTEVFIGQAPCSVAQEAGSGSSTQVGTAELCMFDTFLHVVLEFWLGVFAWHQASSQALVSTLDASSSALQITCVVANTTRGGPNTVSVVVGHIGLAALPSGGLSLQVDTLQATAATPTPLSTIGASSFTITGAGFDGDTCAHNQVVLGGVPCLVTTCSATALVATYPGDADGAVGSANIVSDDAASAQPLAITVRDSSEAELQAEEYPALVSVSSGGATAPYCALAEATAGATLGAGATLRLRCSSAAIHEGVVQLHVVRTAAAGLAQSGGGAGGGRRRLKQAHGRRLTQDQPSSFPSAVVSDLASEAPDPIVCKVLHLACPVDRWNS